MGWLWPLIGRLGIDSLGHRSIGGPLILDALMRQGQRVHPSAVTAVAGANDEIQAAPVDLTAMQLKVEDHEAGICEEQGPNVGQGRHETVRQHTEERKRKTTSIASDEGQMLDVGVMKEEQSAVEGPGGEQGMKRKRAGTRKSKVKTGDAVVKQAGGKKGAVAWDAMTVLERGFGGYDGAKVAVGCSGCQYKVRKHLCDGLLD